MKILIGKLTALTVCLLMLLALGVPALVAVPASAAEEYSAGDVIEYGTYPQSLVVNSALISDLNKAEGVWKSYNYRQNIESGSDVDPLPVSDYMCFKDVFYGGSRYRAVCFEEYRPYFTEYSSTPRPVCQELNGYGTGNIYWFRYDPVRWRILDPESGLVMCETVLDSQPFNECIYRTEGDFFAGPDHRYHASNYSVSSIRKWLNEDFISTAFTDEQSGNIAVSGLDNSHFYFDDGGPYTIEDKVFLLSLQEIRNLFGLSSGGAAKDPSLRLKPTEYAKCQGCLMADDEGNSGYGSYWILRTECFEFMSYAVSADGSPSEIVHILSTCTGIVPALRLTELKSDTSVPAEKVYTSPVFRINEVTNFWEVSYDNGEAWISLGVKATGEKGEKGEKGDTGAQGAQGEQGEKGEKGDTGAKGEQGEKGEKGDTGAQGRQGQDGVGIVSTVINNKGELVITLSNGTVLNPGNVVGEKGEKGDTGAQGAQGIQGEKGEKGDTGAQGAQGIQGEQGEKGEKGDTGAQGEQGIQGEKGEKGEKGDTGAQGAQGIQGEKGEKGEKGDTGADGRDGRNGNNGNDGKDGRNGFDGRDGKDAVTIVGFHYNEEGELIAEMSDGSEMNAGKPAEKPAGKENSFFQRIISFFMEILNAVRNLIEK